MTIANGPGLFVRLRELVPTLPDKAQRIGRYVLAHPAEVIGMSITDLAENAGASEGSIVTFCRRLGSAGFADFKLALSRDLVEPLQIIHEDLEEDDDGRTVARRVFQAHARSLRDTEELLDVVALERAVALLRAAQRIEVYGIGSSAPIAMDLGYRLLQLGFVVKTEVDSHVQAVSAGMAGQGTTVLTISHSGSTAETVLATQLAKEAGAATIGITRLGRSPLQRYCDVLLHTVANETRYRPEAMSSRVAQLAIIDTIISCCALAESPRSIAQLRTSAEIISKKRS